MADLAAAQASGQAARTVSWSDTTAHPPAPHTDGQQSLQPFRSPLGQLQWSNFTEANLLRTWGAQAQRRKQKTTSRLFTLVPLLAFNAVLVILGLASVQHPDLTVRIRFCESFNFVAAAGAAIPILGTLTSLRLFDQTIDLVYRHYPTAEDAERGAARDTPASPALLKEANRLSIPGWISLLLVVSYVALLTVLAVIGDLIYWTYWDIFVIVLGIIFLGILVRLILALRVSMLKRERVRSVVYVRGFRTRAVVALAFQLCCYAYVAILGTSGPIIVKPLGCQGDCSPQINPCQGVNETYIDKYCRRTEDLDLLGSSKLDLLVCDDGGFATYVSAHAACVASRAEKLFIAQANSALMLSLNALLVLVFREVWAEKRELRPVTKLVFFVAALCCPLWLGTILVDTPGAIANVVARGDLAIVNALAWLATILTFYVEYLQAAVRIIKDSVRAQRTHGADASERFDCFLTHDWGVDGLGRDNHERVTKVFEALRAEGLAPWFDAVQMEGDVNARMADGIEKSACVVVFVTERYLDKANGTGPNGADDNCKFEFDLSLRRKGVARMVTVVMEPSCRDTKTWVGAVGGKLGGNLYIDLAADDVFDVGCKRLATEVNKIIKAGQGAFSADPEGQRTDGSSTLLMA